MKLKTQISLGTDFILKLACNFETMELQWGQWILDKLKSMPKNGRYVLMIRHSERYDFNGIPIESWNSTGLTEQGKIAASEFGKALVSHIGIESVSTEGWGLERCVDTAFRIAEGAAESGCRKCSFSVASDLESPIANSERYTEYLKSGRWKEMLRQWLSSPSDSGIMKPYLEYSSKIMKEVLKKRDPPTNAVNIIVTHDLHIFPLITANFNVVKLGIDYMDGILISRGDKDSKVYHRDLMSSISAI